MNRKKYMKPCSKVSLLGMEPLLAGSFGNTNDKKPVNDTPDNQFSKNHKPGSLWDETWDSDDDDDDNTAVEL